MVIFFFNGRYKRLEAERGSGTGVTSSPLGDEVTGSGGGSVQESLIGGSWKKKKGESTVTHLQAEITFIYPNWELTRLGLKRANWRR